jgi:hypothetical protein
MKHSISIILCLAALTFSWSSCRKDQNSSKREPDALSLIAKARAFVSNEVINQPAVLQPGNPRNDRTQRSREIVWSNASIMDFHGQLAVVAPLHFSKEIFVRTPFGGNNNYRLDNQARLLVYQDSAKAWHAEVVTTLPDTSFLNSNQQRFSGLVLVDDWWGNPINKYNFTPDGRVARLVPNANQDASAIPRRLADKVTPDVMIQVCSYISGYNYAVGAEDDGEYWEEFVGCTFMWAPDAGGGGGGSSYIGVETGGGGGSSQPTIYAPTHIILDIKAYLKCFQVTPGATFQVTLCVDQPSPGSRNPWVIKATDGASGSGATSAGHTFLILTENMPGGWSITRSLGFYPSKSIWPLSPPVPGVLNNDENTTFNIAAQYNISSTLFFSMLQFVAANANDNYQVNTYNCTNFALDALNAGHITLPRTIGYWVGGMGVDPGDLGEDIRNYNFSGMTRITTPFLHSNLGTCN